MKVRKYMYIVINQTDTKKGFKFAFILNWLILKLKKKQFLKTTVSKYHKHVIFALTKKLYKLWYIIK